MNSVPTLHDLYTLMFREFGNADPLELDVHGARWVMNLDSYKQVRAAARAAGAIYPADDDPARWVPKPEDRLFGLRVEVCDDGGTPHVELPGRDRVTKEDE